MPKNIIPVRQDPESLRGAPQSGQLSLGEGAAALPTLPPFNPAGIVAKLRTLNEQADRVLAGAERAAITDEKSASVSVDFLASITARINEVDEERKTVTGGFDKLVKGLNILFNGGPVSKLSVAKKTMQDKLSAWDRSERERLAREAEEERQRAAAEAAEQAKNAVDDGDTEAALEILETAAAIEFVPEKPEIRGRSGAMLSTTKRKVGKVTDLRAFIAWAGADPSSMALAVCGGIEVGQKELNQLAATVLAANELAKKTGAPALNIPGFEAGFAESINARG